MQTNIICNDCKRELQPEVFQVNSNGEITIEVPVCTCKDPNNGNLIVISKKGLESNSFEKREYYNDCPYCDIKDAISINSENKVVCRNCDCTLLMMGKSRV